MAEKPEKVAKVSTKKGDKKRKRQEGDESSTRESASKPEANVAGESADGPSRKKSKSKRKKEGDSKSSELEIKKTSPAGGIDESIGTKDGQLMADYLMQKAKKHNKDLTAMELSDMIVPEQAFLDTTSFESPRSTSQLPAFLKAYSPEKGAGLSKAPEEKGSPHTIVVASAGLRAADLVRELRSFQSKDAIVGKLFAKHIKLDEAKQFLQRAHTNIGVGTPQRLIDLLESGALKTQDLERIVIDGSHIDQKKRGIFDMKEIFSPLLQLLNRAEFRERYGAKGKGIQVLVF